MTDALIALAAIALTFALWLLTVGLTVVPWAIGLAWMFGWLQ
jgi:hypothetical protein